MISQQPDVTVVVGSGDKQRTFQTFAVLLAYASPVLDAMLSSGMKESDSRRIEFPTKDPDEFELFLECIDPSKAARFRLEEEYYEDFDYYIDPDEQEEGIGDADKGALLNATNVMKLAPWFHELQMESYLRTCDDVLYYDERKYSRWRDTDTIQQEKMRLLNLLPISVNFSFENLQRTAERKICDLLEPFLWGCNDPNNIDISFVKEIIQLFRPFRQSCGDNDKPPKKPRRNETDGAMLYTAAACQTLWQQVMSTLDLTHFNVEMLNDESFALVVYYALRQHHDAMKTQLRNLAVKLQTNGPDELSSRKGSGYPARYYQLPSFRR
jgi:hypothetical protein